MRQLDMFSQPKKAALKQAGGCDITPVGKRRDGGTRYWCLTHKADATAKYGRPAMACRAAHLPPILPHEILDLDLDQYPGGVGLWGAVPPVYDTTRLPLDFGIHVHARRDSDGDKHIDTTYRAVRLIGHQLPTEGLLISEIDAVYYMVSSVFGFDMRDVRCTIVDIRILTKTGSASTRTADISAQVAARILAIRLLGSEILFAQHKKP